MRAAKHRESRVGTLPPMSTRAIVTSHPYVACFVCERTLLRGEHPEIFLVDGAPQTVCELCAPRAAHHGWPRGHEGEPAAPPIVSSRRGGGLFSRLRPASRPAERAPGASRRGVERTDAGRAPYAARDRDGAAVEERGEEPKASAGAFFDYGAAQPGDTELALEAFNRSEYPRRIASLSRSLGVPDVNVALDEDLPIVTIVVAWELCWYRYRVDLDEQPEVRMIAEGRTLEELERSERACNALADERGSLALIAAAV
jgi:hypothetical protein